MFELEKKYKRGKRTFLYTYFKNGGIISLIAFAIMYLAYSMYFGSLKSWTDGYLERHPDWYVTNGMISSWILYVGIAVLLVGFLRVNLIYSNYKFSLSEHGFHISKGIFFVNERTVPYQQISNVNIERPYLYRFIGLARLDIITTSDTDVGEVKAKVKNFYLPLIDLKHARTLSHQLLTYTSVARNGDSIKSVVMSEDVVDDENDEGNIDDDNGGDDGDSGARK